MIDIKPIRKQHFDCIQGLLATVALHFNRDFALMFLGEWGFGFKNINTGEKNVRFGERLGWRDEDYTTLNLIDKYHNIKVIPKYDQSVDNFINSSLKELDNGIPTGFFLDSYWCPWNLAYQKYHINHFCLLIGYDKNTNRIICIDPFCTDSIELLNYDDLKQGYAHFFTFDFNDKAEAGKYEVLEECIKQIKKHSVQENIFNIMRSFSDEIEELLNINEETKGYEDTYAVPLFRGLKTIEDSRINFALAIRYIAEKYHIEDLLSFSDSINKASSIWSKIRLMTLRMSIIKDRNDQVKNVANKIREVANYEEDLSVRLLEFISK